MQLTFYVAAGVAVLSTLLMLTRLSVVHALLYLIVSLLGVAVVFYVLGAPFLAALEAIVYAGAIMVLFLFVVMMLNLGKPTAEEERQWLTPGIWTGPVLLATVLILELVYLSRAGTAAMSGAVNPKQVAVALFGPYLIGAELSSMLLLGALVGAFHLGFRKIEKQEMQHDSNSHERRADVSGDLVLAGTDQPAGAP